MFPENELREIKILAKAYLATGFLLWSVIPNFLLGWLISAIHRHPEAEKAVSSELVYKVLLYTQGGIGIMPVALLLLVIYTIIVLLSFVLIRTGRGEPVDGTRQARNIVRKFLIPSILSASAFGFGFFSGSDIREVVAPIFLLLSFALILGVFYYLMNTVENNGHSTTD